MNQPGQSGSRRVLVVSAHPDDDVLGMGGTIALHARQWGDHVRTLIITDGSSTQYPGDRDKLEQKRAESRAACAILGVEDHHHLDLPDMRLDTVDHVEVNATIEQHVTEFHPEIVYCVHPDVNRDHVCVFDSVLVAVRPVPDSPVRRFATYAPLSSTEWDAPVAARPWAPNLFVDITDTLQVKLDAMSAFKTELRDPPHPRSLDGIRTFAQREGIRVGVPYAEPLCLMRELL